MGVLRFRFRNAFLIAKDEEDAERVGSLREDLRGAVLQDCEDL